MGQTGHKNICLRNDVPRFLPRIKPRKIRENWFPYLKKEDAGAGMLPRDELQQSGERSLKLWFGRHNGGDHLNSMLGHDLLTVEGACAFAPDDDNGNDTKLLA